MEHCSVTSRGVIGRLPFCCYGHSSSRFDFAHTNFTRHAPYSCTHTCAENQSHALAVHQHNNSLLALCQRNLAGPSLPTIGWSSIFPVQYFAPPPRFSCPIPLWISPTSNHGSPERCRGGNAPPKSSPDCHDAPERSRSFDPAGTSERPRYTERRESPLCFASLC